ncbi:MAG: hypothetical protein QNK05_06645 [Myxococcota bacterium]|nr:hypothetical protein [Myxococcota bacterium]
MLLLPCLVLAASAHARGRVELNQASIDASGGFPVVVTAPTNYVLTSDLVVPAATDGFVLQASDVVVDLNGFSIRGPATCCTPGFGSAIRFAGIDGNRVTVHNGGIRDFAGDCLSLNTDARVEDLMVRSCGRNGVAVGGGSLVEGNRVLDTGQHGIRMSGGTQPPLYSGNAVARSGLGGGSEAAVFGGRAGAGNTCDDGSCSPRGSRRYYLTPDTVEGDHGADDCAPGFQMASIYELALSSNLEYDTALGEVNPDSGAGPPEAGGWARGARSPFNSCSTGPSPWTSDAVSDEGTVAAPAVTNGVPGFFAQLVPCNFTFRVWCIER